MGWSANAKPFEVHADDSASQAAIEMIGEIASGKLDAGLLWGPVGGYYAERAEVPLKLVPLVKEKAGPTTIYGITMGVRPNEPQWKHTINKLIADNQAEINVILEGYSVPLLDEKGNLIAGRRRALSGAVRLTSCRDFPARRCRACPPRSRDGSHAGSRAAARSTPAPCRWR